MSTRFIEIDADGAAYCVIESGWRDQCVQRIAVMLLRRQGMNVEYRRRSDGVAASARIFAGCGQEAKIDAYLRRHRLAAALL